MRSIAIINQKGGVGKTTTAVNFSAALSMAGQRVCLIDLDPQAHASLHLGVALGDDDLSIYDVFTAGAAVGDVRQDIDDHLALIPAHINLAAAELELADRSGREFILKESLAADAKEFDFLVIDCAPSLGLLTLNALAAVDEVLLPLQPHFLALHGLSKLLHTVDAVAARVNPRLRLSGVVLCLYEAGTRLASEVAGDVEAFFDAQQQSDRAWSGAKVMQTRIRRNIRLAEAPSHGQSIFQYDPQSNGAEDYHHLAEELLGQSLPAEKVEATPAPRSQIAPPPIIPRRAA